MIYTLSYPYLMKICKDIHTINNRCIYIFATNNKNKIVEYTKISIFTIQTIYFNGMYAYKYDQFIIVSNIFFNIYF